MVAPLSTKLPWELANPKWAASINPILALPILNGNMISNVSLTATTPKVVNHLLQRMPQGWFLVDNTADAVIWRTQPFTDTTITLEASANTTASIWVF
jgi:hypothetical protein